MALDLNLDRLLELTAAATLASLDATIDVEARLHDLLTDVRSGTPDRGSAGPSTGG